MDNKNWRVAQSIGATPGIGAVPVMMPENTDWRSQLQPDFRQRIVNKIMEKRHLPFTGEEGLLELKKIAVSMEEKVYTAAISLSDYLRKISLKMLTMETKSQPPLGNAVQPNTGTNNQNPADSVSGGIQAQVINQGQQLPMPIIGNQIQARQQLLPQNIQNNMTSTVMRNSARLTTASPSACGMAPASLPSVNGSVHGGDWQEEAYQKIRSMKEMYFVELNELHQRIASKLELHDIPQQPKNEHLEKLKFFKAMLEKILRFLRLNKNDIQIAHREKIGPWEKQIVNILNSNRPRKPVSSLPQGQLSQSHMQTMQQNQQWQSQISQMLPHESQMSSQMQSSLNVQGSVMPMQQNNIANLQRSIASTAQIGSVDGGDWQEDVYQKIRSMKEMYFAELNEVYQRVETKIQLLGIPQQPNEHLEKLKFFKAMLEKLLQFLRLNKNDIQIVHREKIGPWETQIENILNSNRPQKPVSSLPQGYLSQSHMQTMLQNQQSQS